MYLYTAQELQLMHEERIGHLTKQHGAERKEKRSNGAIKQIKKLLKRDEEA